MRLPVGVILAHNYSISKILATPLLLDISWWIIRMRCETHCLKKSVRPLQEKEVQHELHSLLPENIQTQIFLSLYKWNTVDVVGWTTQTNLPVCYKTNPNIIFKFVFKVHQNTYGSVRTFGPVDMLKKPDVCTGLFGLGLKLSHCFLNIVVQT